MRVLLTNARPGVLMTLVVVLSYANSLSGDFQFDDYNVIVNTPQVHAWNAWLASLDHGIRPLLKLSYVFNWTINTAPFGFHFFNSLIHLANVFLIYRLAQSFVEHSALKLSQHIPLVTALLFAAHPIHTEAVTYISGRSASLMTLFYLAALFSYTLGRDQHNKVYLYLTTPLLFACALATKETAITLPFALLLWEFVCGGNWRSSIKQQWPTWLLFFISLIFFVANEHYFAEMQRSAALNSMQGNLATQLMALAYLLRQWVAPLWLNLDPDLTMQYALISNLPELMLLGALCWLMLHSWRARPWLSFALAWMLLHLIPLYLLLPRIDVVNERQMYLASWPLILAVSAELTLWFNHRQFQVSSGALLLILVCLTIVRNQAYQTEISLWEDTARKSPDKARVHNNLGYAYLLAQRHSEARREFLITLQLDPNNYKAKYNLLRLDAAP